MTATDPGLVRRGFRAMNTDIEIFAVPAGRPEARIARAERWLAAFEARFSRFLPTSEVSCLNRSAGRPFRASPALFRLVTLSLSLAERSDGLFDPTVLRHLEESGYDRSFDRISGRKPSGPAPARRRVTPPAGYGAVRVDATSRTVHLPEGTGIDLGGIGKGWAAERAADIVGQPCLVNAGGDIAARGRPAAGGAWLVGVEDPLRPERDVAVLALRGGGVATSSTRRRRWPLARGEAHHLIDPRSGAPAASGVVACTVVGPDAVEADFFAKVVLLLGERDGSALLNATEGVEGMVFREDGCAAMSRGMARHLVG